MNFKKLKIKGIDGVDKELDFDYKGLANHIFNNTQDLGMETIDSLINGL